MSNHNLNPVGPAEAQSTSLNPDANGLAHLGTRQSDRTARIGHPLDCLSGPSSTAILLNTDRASALPLKKAAADLGLEPEAIVSAAERGLIPVQVDLRGNRLDHLVFPETLRWMLPDAGEASPRTVLGAFYATTAQQVSDLREAHRAERDRAKAHKADSERYREQLAKARAEKGRSDALVTAQKGQITTLERRLYSAVVLASIAIGSVAAALVVVALRIGGAL